MQRTKAPASWRSVLSRELAESVLRFLDVLERQLAGFNQMGDDRLAPAAKKAQKLVNQSPLGHVARDQRFENVCVADLLDAAERPFCFQSIDGGLDRRVGRSFLDREGFLDFSNRGCSMNPERIHDPKLQLGQSGQWHA